MYPIEINTWYNIIPDQKSGRVELAKICRMPADPDRPKKAYHWHIVTYYDGRDIFGGTLNDCLHWINNHSTNRRYYN